METRGVALSAAPAGGVVLLSAWLAVVPPRVDLWVL